MSKATLHCKECWSLHHTFHQRWQTQTIVSATASCPTSELSQALNRRNKHEAFFDANFKKMCVAASLRGTDRSIVNISLERVCVYVTGEGEHRDDIGHDVYHWHGPGTICAIELPANPNTSMFDRCFFGVVRGSARFRCAHEQLRAENSRRKSSSRSDRNTSRSSIECGRDLRHARQGKRRCTYCGPQGKESTSRKRAVSSRASTGCV